MANIEDKQDKAMSEALVAIRRVTQNWLAQVEITKFQMRMAKLKFDAALEAGFDRGTAMFIAFRKEE